MLDALKTAAGGRTAQVSMRLEEGSGVTLTVPDGVGVLAVSLADPVKTVSIARLLSSVGCRNRLLILVGDDVGGVTVVNTNNAAAEGEVDLGGSNFTFGGPDALGLYCRGDGSWVRVFGTSN